MKLIDDSPKQKDQLGFENLTGLVLTFKYSYETKSTLRLIKLVRSVPVKRFWESKARS